MRQLKRFNDGPPKDLASMYAEWASEWRELLKKRLVMILNYESDSDPMTGQPLTPELRGSVNQLVATVKRTSVNLELLDPLTIQSTPLETVNRCKNEIAEINKAFSQVRLVPTVQLAPDGRSLNVVEELYVEPGATLTKALQNRDWKISGTNYTLLEAHAVLAITAFLKDGTLDHLRRCDCGDWFVASRADQKFCSSKCRQRNHAAKPDFNSKRREYYRQLKERKVRKREAQTKVKATK